MKIVIIGLNHITAPLQIREKVSFSDINIASSYTLLKKYSCLSESFILSTCNRVEVYGVGYDEDVVADALKDFLYEAHDMMPGCLDKYLYKEVGRNATVHLTRVASGLNSMIIGETQILGQLRRAYERAGNAQAIGFYLHELLQEALRVGKKVRTETNISKGVTSIAGAALELIKQEKALSKKRALVIGAGKIGTMTVSKLRECGVKKIVLMNRSRSKAEVFKKYHNIEISNFAALKEELSKADVIITATASQRYIITQAMVKGALAYKSSDSLFIDMGVPRNIEESVKSIKGVRLYNVDDLGPLIEKTMRNRAIEAEKAQEIIERQVCERLSLV